MRDLYPAEDLARDGRFTRVEINDFIAEGRIPPDGARGKLKVHDDNSVSRAQVMMHGIFMGEVQALEGAGRTAWDFRDDDETPYELRLDMARQAWDEARHVEISVKLMEHMGVELGEFGESTFLYQAACNPDPVLRLTGVNRALEGLAIDVFNTMREFAADSDDPLMGMAEDFMLADEVTHVKMGSDWLRRMTDSDPERRERALEFQHTVDRLFSLGGFRSEEDDAPIKLARRFRELAGFDTDELDEIAGLAQEVAEEARSEAEANQERALAGDAAAEV